MFDRLTDKLAQVFQIVHEDLTGLRGGESPMLSHLAFALTEGTA